MSALYKNRLSGEEKRFPDQNAFLGQWICLQEGQSAAINQNPLENGDYLVPNAGGKWLVLENSEKREGRFDAHLLPDELETASIRTIGADLNAIYESGQAFSEWLAHSPIVPRISEAIELQPLDFVIDKYIPYLEEICAKPRAHLWTEIERVPVSKSRRIPVRALDYLTSHTEDWDRPTLRSVRPKRILSFIADDKWDIYENKIIVTLIDYLNYYLTKRHYELKKAFQLFHKADFSGSTTTGTRHRSERICELWGAHFDETVGYLKAEETLKKIENLRYRVSGLKNSFLYQVVPRQTMSSTQLKMTNIFADDPRYRFVAELWREWLKSGAGDVESPAQVYQKHQELCRGFNRFCMLLALRALDQLRFSPVSPDMPVFEKERIRLKNGFGEIALQWEKDGVVKFYKNGKKILKMIPMPFSPGNHEKTIRHHLKYLAENKGKTDTPVLLFAISGRETQFPDRIQQCFNNIGNTPSLLSEQKMGILLVSPWEIESVERVARALRWFLIGADFLNYPPKIRRPQLSRFSNIKEVTWLKADKGNYKLFRQPRRDEEAEINLEQIRKELLQRREEIQTEANKLDRNSQKLKGLKHDIERITSDLTALGSFEENLTKAKVFLKAITQCPVCGTSETDLQSDDKNAIFSCVCLECNTKWGIRRCNDCLQSFPFLIPDVDREKQKDGVYFHERIDRIFGSDILAVPLSIEDNSFICPYCFPES